MDNRLRKILTECVRELDACLWRSPDGTEELQPYLHLWSDLNAAPILEPEKCCRPNGG